MKKVAKNWINPEYVSPDGYDLCVLCKVKTLYKTEMPVDMRCGYVEGAGQTCPGGCKEEPARIAA